MFKSSSMVAARVRLPWLFTNLVGSLLSGMLLWMFRYTIQEVVAIVSFIPVIAAMGATSAFSPHAHHSWVGHRDGGIDRCLEDFLPRSEDRFPDGHRLQV